MSTLIGILCTMGRNSWFASAGRSSRSVAPNAPAVCKFEKPAAFAGSPFDGRAKPFGSSGTLFARVAPILQAFLRFASLAAAFAGTFGKLAAFD